MILILKIVLLDVVDSRGGVEDIRLEAKNKKKIRGQEQPFQEQILSRPEAGMLKAKDQGHRHKCSQKKRSSKIFSDVFKKSLQKNFLGYLQKIKSSKIFFQAIYKILNNSKNSAVLKPRTGQFSRT